MIIYLFILFLLGIDTIIESKVIYHEFIFVFNITCMMYYLLLFILNKYVHSFNKIDPDHKKMYVVKNYIKSFFLAGLCFMIPHYFKLFDGQIDLLFIKRCVIYYIMNDIIGLLLVKKLPTTTIIHHITTSLCGLAIMIKESNSIDILTLVVLYAIFSSLAFCVNFYLGYRIYSKNVVIKYYLSGLSYWVYLLCCIFNWLLQTYLIVLIINTVPILHIILYFVFIYSVVRDDIILMKWLYCDHYYYKNLLKK